MRAQRTGNPRWLTESVRRKAKAQEKRSRRAARRYLAATSDPFQRRARRLALIWPHVLSVCAPLDGFELAQNIAANLGYALGATRATPAPEPKPDPDVLFADNDSYRRRELPRNPRTMAALAMLLSGSMGGRI